MAKFEGKVEKCVELMLTDKIEDSICFLKEIIQENEFLERYSFEGIGSV